MDKPGYVLRLRVVILNIYCKFSNKSIMCLSPNDFLKLCNNKSITFENGTCELPHVCTTFCDTPPPKYYSSDIAFLNCVYIA
jgi:hypothetical protein